MEIFAYLASIIYFYIKTCISETLKHRGIYLNSKDKVGIMNEMLKSLQNINEKMQKLGENKVFEIKRKGIYTGLLIPPCRQMVFEDKENQMKNMNIIRTEE